MTIEELKTEHARLAGKGAPRNGEAVFPIPPELKDDGRVDPMERERTLAMYTAAVNELPATAWSPRQQELVREHINGILKKL